MSPTNLGMWNLLLWALKLTGRLFFSRSNLLLCDDNDVVIGGLVD
jgi:hypothetical protein